MWMAHQGVIDMTGIKKQTEYKKDITPNDLRNAQADLTNVYKKWVLAGEKELSNMAEQNPLISCDPETHIDETGQTSVFSHTSQIDPYMWREDPDQ